jgi:hypothetical protein
MSHDIECIDPDYECHAVLPSEEMCFCCQHQQRCEDDSREPLGE